MTQVFWPATQFQTLGFFLMSLYILTFGLAFLETTANPFILFLGAKETTTRRLNLSQAFNPMGSQLGMFVASRIVLASLELDKRNAAGKLIFPTLDEATKAAIRTNDLMIIRNPYVILGLVVIVMFVIIATTKMPQSGHSNNIHPINCLFPFVADCQLGISGRSNCIGFLCGSANHALGYYHSICR